MNDACVKLGIPNVYGSIFRFEGQLSVFYAEEGPCYRCMFPEPPPPGLVPSCAEGGVLGILPGTIGTMQATEAIKLLLGIGDPMIGRMMLYDALEMSFQTIKLRKDPNLSRLQHRRGRHRVDRLRAVLWHAGARPQRVQFGGREPPSWASKSVTVRDVKAALDNGDDVVVIDVRDPA